MTFSKRSVLYIFAGAVCVLGLLFSLPFKTYAVETGLDWINGSVEVAKEGDYVWTDGDDGRYGNNPCENISAYSWSRPAGWPVQSLQNNCATPGASVYMTWQKVLPFGGEYWQTLNLADSYHHAWTFPNKGTNGMAMVTNSYADYVPGPSELYYTDDILSTFSAISKDNAGNIVRSPSKPFDHKLTYSDGRSVSLTGLSGISYSANGRWLYVNVNGVGQLRIGTDDFSVFSFASGFNPQYAIYTAISNSGNTVVTHQYNQGLRLYDLTSCEAEKLDYASRNCDMRDLTQDLRDAVVSTLADATKLGWIDVSEVKFQNESELRLLVHYVYDNQGKYMFMSIKTAAAEQPIRYLALGDSFSSGEGSYNYRSVTDFYADENNYNLCHQSLSSYSYLLKQSLSPEWFGSIACSGAVQRDVRAAGDDAEQGYIDNDPQSKISSVSSSALANIKNNLLPGYIPQESFVTKYSPTIATISIGGNDIGFGDIVTACIVNKFFANMQPCNASRFNREQVANSIDAEIPKLSATFSSIRQNLSGDQKLYVVGYPKIVNYTNMFCSLNTPMEQSEREFADHLVNYLNEAIRIAANQAGARFIDMSSAFVNSDHDYRLCGNEEQKAVNGLMTTSSSSRKPGHPVASESFHPNKLGHALMARQVRALTNDFSLGMPKPVTTSSVPSAQFRTELVGDTIITNTNQSFNYITDSIPNLIINSGVQVLQIVSEVPGTIAQDTAASVELHSTPITIGQAVVKPDNTLQATITIPGEVSPGYHQLHILYTDSSGQEYDLYKYVLVVANADDYDGDGVKNDAEPCVFGDPSDIDNDKDGVDDACDGEYAAIENMQQNPTSSEHHSSGGNSKNITELGENEDKTLAGDDAIIQSHLFTCIFIPSPRIC